jgi:Protein of unknown function (DUF3618)
MTTSRRAGKPAAGKPAAGKSAGSDMVPGGTVPGDEQQLLQEIGRTRERLGETVEQLVAKADVKGQTRAKARELAGRVKGMVVWARAKAADRGAGVQSQVAGKTVMARDKAAAGRDQLQARAATAWQGAPEGVRRTASKAASTANKRRIPLAAAAATLIAGYLALRRWRKR